MAKYALKVVPADWELDNPLSFTREQYDQLNDELKQGTRILIYQAPPVDGLIAEAVVHQTFIHATEWPETTTRNIDIRDPQHEYLLPIRVLYQRSGEAAVIPRRAVQEALGDATFPQPDQDLLLISHDTYTALNDGWV